MQTEFGNKYELTEHWWVKIHIDNLEEEIELTECDLRNMLEMIDMRKEVDK